MRWPFGDGLYLVCAYNILAFIWLVAKIYITFPSYFLQKRIYFLGVKKINPSLPIIVRTGFGKRQTPPTLTNFFEKIIDVYNTEYIAY
jgi:hypothetical protein